MQAMQRFFRHLWLGHWQARRAFTPATLDRIELAVGEAERAQRGELRIVIEGGLGFSRALFSLDSRALTHARALDVFAQHAVWDTAENSGVLIYLLMAERRIEILADRGIHARVSPQCWQDMVATCTAHFKQGDYEAGVLAAVTEVASLLRLQFPAEGANPDELGNRPIRL